MQADHESEVREKAENAIAGTCLARDGRLQQISDSVELQWEHDVLDIAALPEQPADVKTAGGRKDQSKTPSASAAQALTPSQLQVRQTVLQAAPLSKDVVEVEELWQEALAEEAEDVALFCRVAVPDWEKAIKWGSDDGRSQFGAAHQGDAALPAEQDPEGKSATPFEWDSDSDTSEGTQALKLGKEVLAASGGQRSTGRTPAERYGWDNACEQRGEGGQKRHQRAAQSNKPVNDREGWAGDQHSESTDMTVDAPVTDGAGVHTSVEATKSSPFPGAESVSSKNPKQMLLDQGLWAPGVSHGAAMPYYFKLPAGQADEVGAGDTGSAEQFSMVSTPEVQDFLRAAQKVDDSGLAPSFDWPEYKLATGGFSAAARVGQLARSGLMVLNANDKSMVFEALPNVPEAEKLNVEAVSAQVVTPPPLLKDAEATRVSAAHEDKVAKEFAVFNVSNDAKYRKTRVGRLGDIAVRTGLLHAPIATNLSQLPLPNTLTREELLRPHHPRYAWWIQRRKYVLITLAVHLNLCRAMCVVASLLLSCSVLSSYSILAQLTGFDMLCDLVYVLYQRCIGLMCLFGVHHESSCWQQSKISVYAGLGTLLYRVGHAARCMLFELKLSVSLRLCSISGDPGQIRVIFQSLPGLSRQVDLPTSSAGQVTVRQLWEMVESAFVPEGPMADMLSLFKPGSPGGFDDVDISGAMDQVCCRDLAAACACQAHLIDQVQAFERSLVAPGQSSHSAGVPPGVSMFEILKSHWRAVARGCGSHGTGQ